MRTFVRKNCNCCKVGFQDAQLGSERRNFGESRIKKKFLIEWHKQECLPQDVMADMRKGQNELQSSCSLT
jgi:hypothetical protein